MLAFMNLLQKFITRAFANNAVQAQNEYLSQASGHADLENRMRELDRRETDAIIRLNPHGSILNTPSTQQTHH